MWQWFLRKGKVNKINSIPISPYAHVLNSLCVSLYTLKACCTCFILSICHILPICIVQPCRHVFPKLCITHKTIIICMLNGCMTKKSPFYMFVCITLILILAFFLRIISICIGVMMKWETTKICHRSESWLSWSM